MRGRRSFFIFIIFSVVAAVSILNCMDKDALYSYSDGSGNRYILTAAAIEYIPVTPETSSSGIYSGGEPAKKPLTAAAYEKAASLLEQAVADRSAHMENRVMGSGMVTIRRGNKTANVVIIPDSEIKRQIEELLQELIQ